MYRGNRNKIKKNLEEDTHTVKHDEHINKNNTNNKIEHKNDFSDDPDSFIYNDNVEYTKVKDTIDDSVNVHKKPMSIDMPLTDNEIEAKKEAEKKEAIEKKEFERKALNDLCLKSRDDGTTVAVVDKEWKTNTLEDDALMAYQLEVSTNTYKDLSDYYSVFAQPFSSYVPQLYTSGDIVFNENTISFEYSATDPNFINTTKYTRAQYVSQEGAEGEEDTMSGMLVAGDMILFKINTNYGSATSGTADSNYVKFNIGFYINEVMTKVDNVETVQSKIKTGILEKPSTVEMYEGDTEILSTAKDTHGNVYVIKQRKKLQDVTNFIQKETITPLEGPSYVTFRKVEPTNMSTFDRVQPVQNYEDCFRCNRLKFSNRYGADMLTEPHPDLSGDVVLPDKFPKEDSGTTKDDIKPFDCYVKGYFVVYRVAKTVDGAITSANDFISQTYSFEMNEYSHMQCYTDATSSNHLMFKTEWFTADLTGKTLYLNKYNQNITAPFCATGGFFKTNCIDDTKTPNGNVFTISSGSSDGDTADTYGTDKLGFAIYSQILFTGTDKNYQTILEALGEEPLDEEEDELVKSQKVSEVIRSKKTTGCCIV